MATDRSTNNSNKNAQFTSSRHLVVRRKVFHVFFSFFVFLLFPECKFSFTIFCFYNALANAVYNHRAKSEGTKDGVGIFDWQMGKTSQADLLIVTERQDCWTETDRQMERMLNSVMILIIRNVFQYVEILEISLINYCYY